MKIASPLASCALAFLAAGSVSAPAIASAEERVVAHEDTQAEPEARPYPLEIEPHFAFGPENLFGSTGLGGGLRASIPLAWGHVGHFADNIALSLGGDLLHYGNCYFGTHCGANYLLVPVAAQWNVRVARRASIFLEGGASVYRGWFDACSASDGPGCVAPSDFGALPTVAIGLRVHIHENVSLIARVGYPTTTFGISFL